MSSRDPKVRAARNRSTTTPSRGPVVAVTGAASGVGDLLTRRLAASEEIKQVIAIDERRGEVSEAQWHILDVRDPAIAEKLRGADVVVHLALDLDLETDAAARTAYNVRGTQTVLTAAAAAGVHRVVLCTSAMVYGALPDNDIPLSEDAELRATAEATGVGDLLEIERIGRRAPRAHPGLNVTVVRPAILVGGTDTALTRYFESPRLLVVAGSRPTWQFCHVEDLVTALEYAALEKADGEFVVGCDGWLEQEEVEELSGIRRMELPSAVALGAAARLHRIGLTPSCGRGPRVHHASLGGQRQQAARHAAGGPGGRTRRCSRRCWRRWRAATRSRAAASAVRTRPRRARRARPWHCSVRRRWYGGRARRGAVCSRRRGPESVRPGKGGESRSVMSVPYGTMGGMASTHSHPGEQSAQDPIRLLAIRDTPITVDEVFRAVGDDAAGGTALFVGTVRNHDGGADVEALGYSCHPSAEAELRRVAEKVVTGHQVRALAAVHRVGDLAVGDLAVVVAVSCPHRAEAFEACRKLIDDLKHEVPIWKHQKFSDGTEEWVGA